MPFVFRRWTPVSNTAGGSFHPARAAGGTAGSPPDLAPPAALARVSMKGVPFERCDVVRFAFPDFTRGAFTSARATG